MWNVGEPSLLLLPQTDGLDVWRLRVVFDGSGLSTVQSLSMEFYVWEMLAMLKYVSVCHNCRKAMLLADCYNGMDLWLFGFVMHRVKDRVPYSWTIDSVCIDCDPEYR